MIAEHEQQSTRRVDLSIDEYHADKSRDSNTSLKKACCPKRAKRRKRLVYTPHEYGAFKDGLLVERDSKAFLGGSMFHAFADGSFADHYIVAPEKMPDAKGNDKATSRALKSFKEWESAQLAEKPFATCVLAHEVVPIQRMYDDIMRNEHLQRLLRDVVHIESSIHWEYGNGHPMKSRPDIETATAIPDFKTSAQSDPEAWLWDAYEMGFHRSAALLQDAVIASGGEIKPVVFIVVPKDPPHIPMLIELDDRAIERGREINSEIIDNVAQWCAMHEEFGLWPLAEWHNQVLKLDLPNAAYSQEGEDSYGY